MGYLRLAHKQYQTHKRCYVCDETKPVSEFYKNKHNSNGISSKCKTCVCAYNKEWGQKNPEKKDRFRKDSRFRRKYGITLAQWEGMYMNQGGLCLLCGGVPTEDDILQVDHCHETGRVRGLIHRTCNTAIGMFGDDPSKCIMAADYLRANE